jgi:SM-20-related protein
MTINNLLDSLTTSGWYVWDDFLNTSEIQSIKDCIPDTLQEAKIGNGGSLQLNTNVRGDVTLWLDDDMGYPIKNYFDKMDDVRQ